VVVADRCATVLVHPHLFYLEYPAPGQQVVYHYYTLIYTAAFPDSFALLYFLFWSEQMIKKQRSSNILMITASVESKVTLFVLGKNHQTHHK
jgi:hypothetical protein